MLQRLPLRPVHISLLGVLFGLLAIPAYAYSLWLGGATVLLSGFLDTLDGALGRKSKQTSSWGSFIDSTVDRHSDFFYLLGIWVYIMCSNFLNPVVFTLLIFFCLSGAYQVSYCRARGEGLGISITIGLFGRAERVLILGIGSVLAGLLNLLFDAQGGFFSQIFLGSILLLLGLGSHITAGQRMIFMYRSLK